MMNTHEDAERPYYVTALLKLTKPRARRSILVENLAKLIHDELRLKVGLPISTRAAEYLVNLAVDLKVLERDIYHQGFIKKWAPRGYALDALFPHSHRELPPDLRTLEPDRLAYLKYYLDADGAFMLYLVREVSRRKQIEQSTFLNEGGVERMINSTVSEYLTKVKVDQKDRRYLHELERKSGIKPTKTGKSREYYSYTRNHKFTPHMEALVDLHILERDPPCADWRRVSKWLLQKDKEAKPKSAQPVIYRPSKSNDTDRTQKFLELFPNISSLDLILSEKQGDYFERAAKLYGMQFSKIDLSRDFDLVSAALIKAYEMVRDDVYRLGSLEAASDLACINLLIGEGKACEWRDIWTAIERLRSSAEQDIRYHRDNLGVIRYIVIDKDLVRKLTLSEPVSKGREPT
jgi:hypothetical protein